MGVPLILVASILLQLTAAALALRLIGVTGRRGAWMLIAAAVCLMALRRIVVLYHGLSGAEPHALNMVAEVVALVISALMVAGVARIAPLFRDIQQSERVLQESEARYRALVEQSLVGVYLFTEQGFVYVNRALAQMFGYRQDEMVEHLGPLELTHPEDRPLVQENIRRRLVGEAQDIRYTFRGIRQDGSVLHCEVFGRRITYQGRPAIIGTLVDITDRKQAEEALQRYVYRLEMLREIDRAILAARSPEEVADAVLQHLCRLIPCERACMVLFDLEAKEATILATRSEGEETSISPGMRVSLQACELVERIYKHECVLIDDLSTTAEDLAFVVQKLLAWNVRSSLSVGLTVGNDLIGALNLGARCPHAFTPEHLDIAREVARPLAIAVQQARLLSSLHQQREQLRALTARLAEVEEVERQRLARELHDRVGQNLTVLSINLNVVRSLLPADAATQVEAQLDDALALVEETAVLIRDVMADLRPPVLDDYGVVAALRWYGERFSRHTGVAVQVQGQEPTLRLPSRVEMALFRIAQEALTNVAKHAQASQVTLTLEAVDDRVRLTIADDGVGFEPGRLDGQGDHQGWGILTMQERAAAVGGTLHVKSAPGAGTQVIVEVPQEANGSAVDLGRRGGTAHG